MFAKKKVASAKKEENIGLENVLKEIRNKYGEGSIMRLGESKKVELKETLRWDIKENKINRDLEKVVLKTICGFLNSYGGTLIIGVNDKKEVTGLTRDYVTLPKKNSDGFQNHLIQLVKQAIGITHLHNIDIGFHHKKLARVTLSHHKIEASEDSPLKFVLIFLPYIAFGCSSNN